MYSVVVERFLKDNTVVVADNNLMSFGYPALTFQVKCDNKSFWKMIGSSSKTILTLEDSTLEMTIAVPVERDVDWEKELKVFSIKEPIDMTDRIVYTVRIPVTITPLDPSHSQVSD